MTLETFSSANITNFFFLFILGIFSAIAVLFLKFLLGYGLLLWYKNRNREKESLDSTLLEVCLPRDNEIKIDAAEQMFASFASLRRGGKFSFLNSQPHISFEIVGMPEDIRFYVNTPNKLKDFVEKQINGAYPEAEIKEVAQSNFTREGYSVGNEYNIFPKTGKVAFASLKLKSSNYMPIKVFKDLPTDPLSSVTSVLAKMAQGEGAAIQIMLSSADSKWKKQGRTYISKTKKAESNPETAKYSADPKELEGIENKIGKPGFDVVIRIVVSSSTVEAAQAHLNNIVNSFSQFDGLNSFTKNSHRFKGLFMHDFIYRYTPIRGQTSVLTNEELSTVFHFPNKSVQKMLFFLIHLTLKGQWDLTCLMQRQRNRSIMLFLQ